MTENDDYLESLADYMALQDQQEHQESTADNADSIVDAINDPDTAPSMKRSTDNEPDGEVNHKEVGKSAFKQLDVTGYIPAFVASGTFHDPFEDALDVVENVINIFYYSQAQHIERIENKFKTFKKSCEEYVLDHIGGIESSAKEWDAEIQQIKHYRDEEIELLVAQNIAHTKIMQQLITNVNKLNIINNRLDEQNTAMCNQINGSGAHRPW